MNILAISGSLRKGSSNTLLLKTAAQFFEQKESEFNIFDISGIPFYNSDVENDAKPEAVVRLNDAIAQADGLIIASPEYNHSVSGVLKNTLDWVSRPAFESVLLGKPVGVLSAAMSPSGGVRGQVHLREILACTLTPVYLTPDYLLPFAHKAFDENGVLINQQALEQLKRYLNGYLLWVEGVGNV